MSSELLTSTTKSAATVAPIRRLPRFELPIQQRKTFFEVQRRVHVVEHQPELHHREGHLRLQPDDHGVRAAHRVMWAIVRIDRAANESITSIAVTSTMMPWAR